MPQARSLRNVALACLLTLSVGCTSETSYGKCVGVDAEEEKDPKLVYKTSLKNAILSVLFFELIVPPIVWLCDEFSCPVARR